MPAAAAAAGYMHVSSSSPRCTQGRTLCSCAHNARIVGIHHPMHAEACPHGSQLGAAPPSVPRMLHNLCSAQHSTSQHSTVQGKKLGWAPSVLAHSATHICGSHMMLLYCWCCRAAGLKCSFKITSNSSHRCITLPAVAACVTRCEVV